MAAKVPFCIDISKETFEMLNSLLDLCDPTTAKDRRNQWLADNCDRICIYALKLLKLQARIFYFLIMIIIIERHLYR